MIRFAHIPKTSGYSLYTEFHPTRYNMSKSESCLPYWYLEDNNVLNGAIFREPVSHVFSQYKECRFDTWGKKVTANTDFPRSNDVSTDFEKWLLHFTKPTLYDFNCYHPFNMQTRYSICNTSDGHHDLYNWPSDPIKLAKKNIDKLQWVGIQSMFHETYCVVYYNLFKTLHSKCNCKYKNTKHVHVRHNVPSNVEKMTDTSAKYIERFIQLDREIFKYAQKRAISDILYIQNKTKTIFWCSTYKL